MDAETGSGQAPSSVARRFYFAESAVHLVYIFVTSQALANVANAPPVAALPSTSTTPLCPFLLGCSDCAPRVSIPSVPEVPLVSRQPVLSRTHWLRHRQLTGLAL